MDYISIGQRIAKVRKKKKMTQEKLAEKIDSSSAYVSNIERAAKQPSLSMLIKIANALEVSLDYLVLDNYSKDRIKVDVEIQQIIFKLNKLCSSNKSIYFDISNSILDRLIKSEDETI